MKVVVPKLIFDEKCHLRAYKTKETQCIFLEDGNGCRYCRESDYELERLLIPDKLAQMAAPFVSDNVDFDLWMCERGRMIAVINDENAQIMQRVSESSTLIPGLQKEIRTSLNAGSYTLSDSAGYMTG